jgi:hypothetical protein
MFKFSEVENRKAFTNEQEKKGRIDRRDYFSELADKHLNLSKYLSNGLQAEQGLLYFASGPIQQLWFQIAACEI